MDKKQDLSKNDDETKKLMEEWDQVRCHYCKKKVSLLNAKLVRSGNKEYFVCRSCIE